MDNRLFAETSICFTRDPSPFTCDIPSLVENLDSIKLEVDCGLERGASGSQIKETGDLTSGERGQETGSFFARESKFEGEIKDREEDLVLEAESGEREKKKKKKKGKKRLTPISIRLYKCDWCQGQASFKSGQGLRFHKTIRCPQREEQLGSEYFKCDRCRKAFVTQKGLSAHKKTHKQAQK